MSKTLVITRYYTSFASFDRLCYRHYDKTIAQGAREQQRDFAGARVYGQAASHRGPARPLCRVAAQAGIQGACPEGATDADRRRVGGDLIGSGCSRAVLSFDRAQTEHCQQRINRGKRSERRERSMRRLTMDHPYNHAGLEADRRGGRRILHIAVTTMSHAVKAVTTERGLDAGSFLMVVYGGAGPLHASAIAREKRWILHRLHSITHPG
jgi:hypothetical protein